MKKIRISVCAMLLAFAMICMTGCGNNDTPTESATSQAQTTMSATSGGGTTSGNGTTTGVKESDTGVIEGLVDDVEDGVDDLTGNRETTSSAAADESR